jgi:hypothetical protein
LYYKDCLSDTAIQSITLKGELYGSTLCFYIDRYQALTVYENLNENYIYTPMTISDIKKKCYKQHLWKRSFTYESKRNCSC